MDILEDRYFIFAKKLLSFFGVWYTQSFRECVIRTFITGFILFYLFVSQLCQLLVVDFNLPSIVLVLQTLVPVLSTTSIYFLSILHFVTFKEIFSRVVQDYKQLKDEVELKIMRKYINESKLFSVICGFLFYLFLSFNLFPFVLQIITSTNEVTADTDGVPRFACFTHFLKGKHYYYPVTVYEILTTVITTTIAIICYTSYFWFIQHACAHLCIIKSKMYQLFEKDRYKGKVLEKPLDLSDKTIDIIQCLSRTRDFITLVNNIGKECYLFQTSLAFLLIVLGFLCAFQMPILLQHKETRNDAIAFIIFILNTMFPLYLNFFVGQRLINYSIEVYREASLIPIHEISVKTQKLLLTMLMMNAKPLAISIGKIFVSSHEFFSDLLRKSFSFAMMLHSTQRV